MSLTNHIVPYVVSDEEAVKQVDSYSDWLEGVLDYPDEKSNPKVVEVDDGDDDCVVLDGDPYKTKESELDTCETDEVVVLGQKGEIACRDFPHPRHACAKYPFNSTLHQSYCEMCHCYVCDIRAPCANWSTMGFSETDHCHANDKQQIWKDLREWFRTGKFPSHPVSKPSSQVQQVSQPRFVPPPQNLTQFGIRPCSASTMVTTHLNSYIGPGYRAEQSRTFIQNPGLQPPAAQLYQNYRGGSYIDHSSPQLFLSDPYAWTRTPSNGVHQGAQNTHFTPPTRLQGNPQLIANGYISTVPESQNKEYHRQFSRNMYSCNVQTSAVPFVNPNPLARQQQQQQQQLYQSVRSNDKMLSEIEDWLMDNSAPTGHENATTFDLETFLR